MPPGFLPKLSQTLAPGRLQTGGAALKTFESDALTAFKVRPEAVVIAETQRDVIDTVRLCYEYGVPFVARGSGTSLSGGSLPVAGGVVVALNKLNRVLKLDAGARTCVVEPGVLNAQVTRVAAPHGLHYAPDPSSGPVCTIGGNVAFNSGGAHCLKYGMTANHVLGLKVVLPDGEVAELGGDSLEPLGPDLVGLFVGSEGLFGIALEVTLRLLPLVESYQTVLAAYSTLEAAGNTVTRIVASGLLPGAMEIMDRLAMDAAEAAVHAGYPADAQGLLIVELEGPEEEVAAETPRLLALLEASGAYRVDVAQNGAERAKIWRGRKGAFSAVGRISPEYLVQDGVVPRSRLGEALAAIKGLSGRYSLRVANVFHAGDGNLHPLILFDSAKGELARAEELAGEILRLCIRMGGSITGEHGVGVEKRAYLPEQFSAADMAVMRRLRQAVDPKELANRGKMLAAPVAAGAAPAQPLGGSERHGPAHLKEHVARIQEAVRQGGRLWVRGGGSKPALSRGATLELKGVSGVLEYDPHEYTLTALAGTPLAEIDALLAAEGQHLPFDPPLAAAGATLGGTVAAGLSGPGRARYGGVGDFLLGVTFVSGSGELVTGGGRVVKNAAGFDLPKLLVGSLGRFGVMVALTFKVFPRPEAYATLLLEAADLAHADTLLKRVARSGLEAWALELLPPARLLIRFGGLAEALPGRLERVQALLGHAGEHLTGDAEAQLWREANTFSWAEGHTLVKVAHSPRQLRALEAALEPAGAARRYSVGGNACYLAWPGGAERRALEGLLNRQQLPGLALTGSWQEPQLGVRTGGAFLERVTRVFDPKGVFVPQGAAAEVPGAA